MFTRQFARAATQSTRLVAPRAVRSYSVPAAKHSGTVGNFVANIPVDVYPLGVVVVFACSFGVYSGVRALRREPDMLHHRSAGDPHATNAYIA